jgi:hypothetical protein
MMTEYTIEDKDTLLVTNELPTGGMLCRYFNFAAGHVTTIFVQQSNLEKKEGYSNPAVSVSTALTSQMQIQNFSSLDYTAELEEMHKILKQKGGTPRDLDEQLIKKINKSGGSKLQ